MREPSTVAVPRPEPDLSLNNLHEVLQRLMQHEPHPLTLPRFVSPALPVKGTDEHGDYEIHYCVVEDTPLAFLTVTFRRETGLPVRPKRLAVSAWLDRKLQEAEAIMALQDAQLRQAEKSELRRRRGAG